MRLFTAIDLPREMLEKIGDFLARLRPLASLRWTPVENLHITTKFIGEWPEARIDDMKAVLGSVTSAGRIEIALRGVGWFPSARRPHTFWAGVDGGEPLVALARGTEQGVAKLGMSVETRVYSPHLTLARVKDAVPVDDVQKVVADPDFGAFEATSFFLYVSAQGKYSKLAEFPFNS
jgi:2'-5' RNA ligase